MDSVTFKERVKRLKEVNSVIAKLDEAIRAAAFSLLSPYVTGQPTKSQGSGSAAREHHGGGADQPADTDEAEAFFTEHTGKKPAENAVVIAAYLYSQYGKQPFGLDEVRGLAESTGVTIPDHPAMTLKQTKRNGKALFQHVGRNQYKPTVHGEIYFKQTYAVKKGAKRRPAESES
jgi:hypothetical protein